MKCYKLTTQENTTYGGCLWGEGVTHKTSGRGNLCSKGWFHAYPHPLIAILLNPIHANIQNPKLWECEGEGEHKENRGLKGGYTKLTTVREIPLPSITCEHKIRFAIFCAQEVYSNKSWQRWAEAWLDGSDRTADAAVYAAEAVDADIAYAADAADAAIDAADAAAEAAEAAIDAAYAVDADVAYAADAAVYAAYAADAAAPLDLIAIAKKAVEKTTP